MVFKHSQGKPATAEVSRLQIQPISAGANIQSVTVYATLKASYPNFHNILKWCFDLCGDKKPSLPVHSKHCKLLKCETWKWIRISLLPVFSRKTEHQPNKNVCHALFIQKEILLLNQDQTNMWWFMHCFIFQNCAAHLSQATCHSLLHFSLVHNILGGGD